PGADPLDPTGGDCRRRATVRRRGGRRVAGLQVPLGHGPGDPQAHAAVRDLGVLDRSGSRPPPRRPGSPGRHPLVRPAAGLPDRGPGLMKAQMVKNAVIVPTGSKGGFVLKRVPQDPEALRQEVRRQYIRFMRGLLDLTDNLVDGKVVHPTDVVVHDEDDPYLVVAADKGTAALSDTANEV